jgi:hypothetical protein
MAQITPGIGAFAPLEGLFYFVTCQLIATIRHKMRKQGTTTRSAKFDEGLIEQVKRRFEEKTGWGSSESWNNQDFIYLSEWIQKDTGVVLSHVTLKRFWGKVRCESNPSTHTVNTLVQFLGYKWWRDFWEANNSPDKKEML